MKIDDLLPGLLIVGLAALVVFLFVAVLLWY